MRHLLPLLFFCALGLSCSSWSKAYNPPSMSSSQDRARTRLSVAEQRQFDKCYLEALRQKHKENYDVAFELLDAALRINPHASEALYEQALLLIQLPSYDDSLLRQRGDEQLLLAHQLEPRNPHYRQSLADYYIQTQRYARAARLYEQMVSEHPKSETLETLLRLYQLTKNYGSALSTLDRLEAAEGRNEKSSLRRYAIYNAMGQPTRAFQSIWALCEEYPQEPRYRLIMGDLYLQNGYPEAALSLYGDVLTTDSTHAMARSSMVNYYYMVDSTALFHQQMARFMADSTVSASQKGSLLSHYAREALERRVDKERMYGHFLSAVQHTPGDLNIAQMAASFVHESKLPEDSLRPLCEAVLHDDPSNEGARLQLLSLLIKQRDLQRVQALAIEGIAHQPEQLLYYHFGGLCYIEQGQKQKAYELLQRAVQHIASDADSSLVANIFSTLGDVQHELGRLSQAFVNYERALSYDPDHINTLNNYAYFLSLQRQQLHKALSMSSKAIEQEAHNPTYLDTHAWVLYQLGRYPQARQYIDQCLHLLEQEEESMSNDASLYDHAGDIYYRCGLRPQALQHWKHAEQLTDDPKLRKQLQQKLRRKRP